MLSKTINLLKSSKIIFETFGAIFCLQYFSMLLAVCANLILPFAGFIVAIKLITVTVEIIQTGGTIAIANFKLGQTELSWLSVLLPSIIFSANIFLRHLVSRKLPIIRRKFLSIASNLARTQPENENDIREVSRDLELYIKLRSIMETAEQVVARIFISVPLILLLTLLMPIGLVVLIFALILLFLFLAYFWLHNTQVNKELVKTTKEEYTKSIYAARALVKEQGAVFKQMTPVINNFERFKYLETNAQSKGVLLVEIVQALCLVSFISMIIFTMVENVSIADLAIALFSTRFLFSHCRTIVLNSHKIRNILQDTDEIRYPKTSNR